MNLLLDLVPKEVTINNRNYKINTDFRTCILFEMMLNDNEVPQELIPIQALQLFYPILPNPQDYVEAINKIIWFYSGGKEEKTTKKNKKNSFASENIYDFNYDDEYIYSAFLSTYNIDLQDVTYLHWWKFKALFIALPEDTKIMQIIKYRGIDLSSIKDPVEKKFYKKMKEIYKLPNKFSKAEKEKINKIEEALLNGGDLSKLTIESR